MRKDWIPKKMTAAKNAVVTIEVTLEEPAAVVRSAGPIVCAAAADLFPIMADDLFFLDMGGGA